MKRRSPADTISCIRSVQEMNSRRGMGSCHCDDLYADLHLVPLSMISRSSAGAILALVHDVLVVLTCYSLLRISVGSTFIACMLTIIGYSINDTIVVFDRIRETLKNVRTQDEAALNERTRVSTRRSHEVSIPHLPPLSWYFYCGCSA